MVAQQPAPPQPAPAQLLAPEQLDTLVAPIALYPDALLSQVLVASTYPEELAEAGQWLQQNRNLRGPQLVDAARQQSWDPSIQALVVFPDVIGRLNADMSWTTDIGNAFLAQQADVMGAVQRMRAQAMAAGKLRSTPQETVTTQMEGDQSAIAIQPANPEIVYVPSYNPEYIWGPPGYGYYPAWDYPYYGYGFGYGPGIYIGGFFGGLGWGGWGWGPNWFNSSIYQNYYFFNHYGFHGIYGRGGVGGRGIWAHDAGHRRGVPYSNSALMNRYGGASAGRGASRAGQFGRQSYAAGQRSSAQAGGWNRFGQGGRSTPAYSGNSGYRASPSYRGGYGGSVPSYRSSPSYGNSYSGNRGAPSYRSSPSYGNRGAYRASPSYGGSYGGNRSAPSYRSSPSYGGNGGYRASPSYGGGNGGSRSAPSYRSSPSNGGGGGSHGGRSSSGGGSSHSSGNSGGGHGRR